MIPLAALDTLCEKSRRCVQRCENYKSELENKPYLHSAPKRAAVLVLLYEHAGQLRVLLTTRSKNLRSHPGQTALPGGKSDDTDKDAFHTAYREAHEEVGLPLDCAHVHTICALDPFISKYKLLVTPVIALLTDPAVLDNLEASEAEVDHIFTHPLEALLDPSLAGAEPLVPVGSSDWPYHVEYHNTSDGPLPWCDLAYRMHRFRSAASPIKGMTSDILIKVAEIAYGKQPTYERWPSNQATGFTAAHQSLVAAVMDA